MSVALAPSGEMRGRIAVFVDGATTPALEAKDTTLKTGRVGLGSFDETGQYKNVVVMGF